MVWSEERPNCPSKRKLHFAELMSSARRLSIRCGFPLIHPDTPGHCDPPPLQPRYFSRRASRLREQSSRVLRPRRGGRLQALPCLRDQRIVPVLRESGQRIQPLAAQLRGARSRRARQLLTRGRPTGSRSRAPRCSGGHSRWHRPCYVSSATDCQARSAAGSLTSVTSWPGFISRCRSLDTRTVAPPSLTTVHSRWLPI